MFDLLNLKTKAFGIDISDFSVKIANLKRTKSDFNLACFGEERFLQGLVEKGEIKDAEALAKIIRKTIEKAKGEKIKIKEVICSLPDEKSFLKIIQFPKMSLPELEKAVFFEAENHIPIPTGEACLDFEKIEPLVNHLDHCDVLVAAASQKTVDSYAKTLKLAGLRPIAFDIESLSISRALVKNWLSVRPVLLIDFSATRTVMIVYSGRTVRFSSSIAFSSEEITRIISSELKISSEEAKKIQRNYGIEAKPIVKLQEKTGDDKLEKEIIGDHRVFKILEPLLSGLVAEIKNFLDFYYSHTEHEHLPSINREIKRVLLSGGGANLKGLDKYLSKKLGISVVFGNPWVNILSEPETSVPEEYLRRSLSYANVLGLALRGAIINDN